MIGIIGAMQEEIELLKSKIINIKETKIYENIYYSGIMNRKEIVITKCGIGKVNAAFVTQTLITNFNISAIINIGLSGSVSEELNIGDIVISNRLVYHDVDVTAFGYNLGQIPSFENTFFEADDELINSAKKNEKEDVHIGIIATGDQFINNLEKRREIKEKFNALCVEMEGAAIAHICFLNKVPFVVIRSISDKASGEADSQFEKNLKFATEKLAKILEKIIGDYNGI
ncbi:MAG: 5'-methylthioadenosine/adenosylhomocysteine nucleosidase [Defluviitaleaceae bacterium]|nr:5'-methylthioadenosine/adenosylhomocysteine nucleosidase [Defluviitaleaceae bacterium]